VRCALRFASTVCPRGFVTPCWLFSGLNPRRLVWCALRACEPGGRTFESCRAHQPLGNQHLIKPRITAFSLPLNDGHSPDPNLLDIEMRCVWMVWNSMR
jgi:hypothetical protein